MNAISMSGANVRLARSVSVVEVEDATILHRGADALRVRGGAQLVAALRVGQLPDELPETACALMEQLHDLGWLVDASVDDQRGDARVSRQFGYLEMFGEPHALQRSLDRSVAAIVGVGGVGSLVADLLAAAGVRSLVLVDPDSVAADNLNRQLIFGEGDVGRPKVLAVRDNLLRRRPDMHIETHQERVGSDRDLDGLQVDLLFVAADQPADLMDRIWPWCARTGVAVMRASVGLERGSWGPLLDPGEGHCWPCFSRHLADRSSPLERAMARAGQSPTPWSFGPSNAAIASLAARDAIVFLAGARSQATETMWTLDMEAMSASSTSPSVGCGCVDRL